jgi:NAD(P)-dependent dehydrogenase (short-subunit alcohol dehydrogenase family)
MATVLLPGRIQVKPPDGTLWASLGPIDRRGVQWLNGAEEGLGMAKETALIVGAGSGLSASLARACAKEGMAVALAARDTAKLGSVAAETGARVYRCDAADAGAVQALFQALDDDFGALDLAVYNASYRTRGSIADLDPAEVERSLRITAYGGFLVAQEAARRMLARGGGSILLTGASASVKGYAQSAPFAMGKFALRGLAQSMARELAPKNIHVAHFVIDGGIRRGEVDPRGEQGADGLLDPDAIAAAYLQIHRQHRSAWTWEVELRPWTEKF